MTVRRVIGIETEFGISVPGEPTANPILLSGEIVSTYAAAHGIRPRRAAWDYYGEDPLHDARGWSMQRWSADESQLTDDPATTNIVLTNGARFYVDHAHPEYSSPEVTTPRDAVIWDRAGELVALESVRLIAGQPGRRPIHLYRNNTDGKGASYGSHENYLMPREVPFTQIVAALLPFFAARQVVCGAGRVGIGQESRRPGFQISQRADFFETEVGLETTLRRPMVNTRDEPHALPDAYRRLHVIIGDANQCDVPNLLKVGVTSLVLALVEHGCAPRGIALQDPVRALHEFSHDATLRHTVETADGRRVTALDLLWAHHDAITAYLDAERTHDPVPAATREVVALFEDVLTRLGRDPMECAGDLEWVTKLQLLEGYRQRDHLSWDNLRLEAIDLQWADIRPEKGLARQLEARGRIRRLVSDTEIRAAVTTPPVDTRAWFRGECLRRYPDEIASASWDSVVVEVAAVNQLQRIATNEPERGTKALIGELLDRCPDAAALVTALSTDQQPTQA